MKNNALRLIATLPSISNWEKIRVMLAHDALYGVRLNTGAFNPMDEIETVGRLAELCRTNGKRFWVDLKCRQLRVTRWAAPEYQCIEVNHAFTVDLPAKLCLRGEAPLNIAGVYGNKIVVDSLPRHAVGEGQSINVLGENLVIDGYLIEKDLRYLEACLLCGVQDVMASYAELPEDVQEIRSHLPEAKIVCKIESLKGLRVIDSFVSNGCSLMAARDDLYIESGYAPSLLAMAEQIAKADRNAICASRIFQSLEHGGQVQLSDYADLELMRGYGYRSFMLSDRISINYFDAACDAWRRFIGP